MFNWLGQTLFRYIHEKHLVYAACWEDPLADRLGLEIGSTDRLLVITSAGCNVFDYLLEEPEHIYAVDMNYRQNSLLELKIAAIKTLRWEDFFAFFGTGHHSLAVEIYKSSLRDQLTEQHRAFWDRSIGMFCGRLSFYFRTTSGYFASWCKFYLDHVIRVREPIQRLLNAKSIEEQISVYESELKNRFWGPWLGWALRRSLLLALSGIPPQQREQFQKYEPDIQAYLRRRAEHVIYNLPIAENYFWRVYLTGSFTQDCCPRYLRQEHFDSLKRLVSRITSHTCTVEQFLNTQNVRITRLILLDHLDWLTGDRSASLAAEWQAIYDSSAPDARILWRSLGLNTEFIDEVIIKCNGEWVRLGDLLEYATETARSMRESERVSVYGCLNLVSWRGAKRKPVECQD
jgi:S-adenosylmethionine-diacylglycerol 3-amino-3-carboxypropyl transferase